MATRPQITFAAVLAMVFLVALANSSTLDAGAPEDAVAGKWSVPVEGVRVRLSSKKATYAPGETIKLCSSSKTKPTTNFACRRASFCP